MLRRRSVVDFWNRPYRLTHEAFEVIAKDGVRIAGVHIHAAAERTPALLLYVHGFMSGKNHRNVPNFVEALATYSDVMAIDLRGHGDSDGGSTLAALEVQDVEAAVFYARALGYEKVITIGSSMGGASVIRHAALYQDVEAVATIGAFANPRQISPSSDAGLKMLMRTGQFGAAWSYFYRKTVFHSLPDQEPPYQVIDKIAPRPLLLIHGEWDTVVDVRSARLLYDHAGEPKELIIIPRGGHDHPNLNKRTAARVYEWLVRHNLLAAQPSNSKV